MQKQIEIQKRNIPYTLKISNKAKHVRLAVYHGGNVVVTAPWYITVRVIEEFILRKSKWILEKIDYFISLPPPLVTKSSKIEFIKYKAVARKIARDKMNYFNQLYGFTWRRISIKNTKTRWGSCSKKGNINFNYKIALLPERQVDYIIVHELCHLGELNHSRRFWNLVAKSVPDYKSIRKDLRKNHLTLN
ncbi:MAG: M48 family metallopeptidase [Candidatus Magasanikbacteria bacterium]|nr:M48 family metallopeptidase [Candidatus Magasanikbacteria bacterium]